MAERWVANASPLIVLAKLDQQDLLTLLADEVAVPRAVVDEIQAGPPDDPARLYLNLEALPISDVVPEPVVQAWDLGYGETAVLSYALQNPGWTAVIDDGLARRCAVTLSIPIVGTLGIILRARRAELIPAATPLLRGLIAQGFRIDVDMVRHVLLESVGEILD